MTFSSLKALHAIIGEAIDEIESVYLSQNKSCSTSPSPLSPPPSPSVYSSDLVNIDFPSLDAPFESGSLAETLTSNPVVTTAINRIVAAAGQLSATVQVPFLTICDASMGYHLPSCLHLLEASHIPEILRSAGPSGVHVEQLSQKTGVDPDKLAHILRLLATHHITHEVSPNVFANNRISSLIDSGKPWEELVRDPDGKYKGTNGIAAFVGLCTDELMKSSAYLTEAYLPTAPGHKPESASLPTRAPFNYAFDCEGVGFFGWLEGEGSGVQPNPNMSRLLRFSSAMTGTESWEPPGTILTGFDWASLPRDALVVDVGGGIGSASMLLASAFSSLEDDPDSADSLGLRFVIQDRGIVIKMGEKAWRDKCPRLLDEGIVKFQVHDFFAPQPITNASVFLLRVVLHDWPDSFARRILLRLRESATPKTRLLIADWVLPLACTDDFDLGVSSDSPSADLVDPVPYPLLANLGKASANVYWMDLTMQCTFNGKERTLREIVELCRLAGWKVTRVVKATGSLFGYVTAVPVPLPLPLSIPLPTAEPYTRLETLPGDRFNEEREIALASSRCGTPTPFGSGVLLPDLEATKRGGLFRNLGLKRFRAKRKPSVPSPLAVPSTPKSPTPPTTKRKMSIANLGGFATQQQSPAVPASSLSPSSPRLPRLASIGRRPSFANLNLSLFSSSDAATPPVPSISPGVIGPVLLTPASPTSPNSGTEIEIDRRPSVSSLLPPPSLRGLGSSANSSRDELSVTLTPKTKKGNKVHQLHSHSQSFSGSLISAPLPSPTSLSSFSTGGTNSPSPLTPSTSSFLSLDNSEPGPGGSTTTLGLSAKTTPPRPSLLPRMKSHIQLTPKSISRKRSESVIGFGRFGFGGKSQGQTQTQTMSDVEIPQTPSPGTPQTPKSTMGQASLTPFGGRRVLFDGGEDPIRDSIDAEREGGGFGLEEAARIRPY